MIRVLAFLLSLLAAAPASAANRFWNPYSVTGAISGTGGVCRLTISPAIVGGGLVTGSSVITSGLTGVTGCDVTTTITVISTTQIELVGTTFGGAVPVGGCVAGGNWTATNTANWAASSTATCGSGGSSVPSTTDNATFDANSLGGTIIPTFNINLGTAQATTFTWGAFAGTIDFSVNNVNLQVGFFSGAGTAVRTFHCGSGTFTVSPNAYGLNSWLMNTVTNLTWDCPASININNPSPATAGWNTFAGGGLTYGGAVTLGASSKGGTSITGANNFAGGLNIAAPNSVQIVNNITLGTASVWSGSQGAPIFLEGASASQTTVTGTTGAFTGTWLGIVGLTFVTSNNATFAWTNSFRSFFATANIDSTSYPSPSGGGGSGGGIIGGGL